MKTKQRTNSQKGKFSKSKGANFERLMAKTLSLWISSNKSDSLLWRSAMSGGRASIAIKEKQRIKRLRTQQAGDLSATSAKAERFMQKFFIECKRIKKTDFESAFNHQKGHLSRYFATAAKEAEKYGKSPFLIIQGNFQPVIGAIHKKDLNKLLKNTAQPPLKTTASFEINKQEVLIFHLKEMLKCAPNLKKQ